ncbi:MAG TPA: Hpt domain-containing protein, partial [Burkholderiales bacterium]|nr:Hpt domain-containing protein [Burkholderiales bacterium]
IMTVRQLYELDTLFSEPDMARLMTFDMNWLRPALNDARSRLEVLKATWLQYAAGEPRSATRFRELVGSFKARAGELGNPHLVKLLDAIALVTTRLPDPYPAQSQLLVVEMASAFLFVESILDSFTDPPADLEKQIVIMGGWLLDAAKGKSTGEPPRRLRVDLSRRIGALQLRAKVASEIFANLRHVEQTLDGFARDAGKRDTLPALKPYLRQIHGALVVLSYERAAQVLSACEAMIADCALADPAQTARNLDWIAEGLSTLEFYLEPCVHGGEPVEQALKLFFSRFENRDAPAGRSGDVAITIVTGPGSRGRSARAARRRGDATPAPEVVKTSVMPGSKRADKGAAPRPEIDGELLSIYLDEAGEVLAGIDLALPQCRTRPDDREALTTIRRGFHTLKGSGRMVGLTDLGEIAWQIEQVMNEYLEQQRPATPGLLELIANASASFAGWIADIRAGKPVEIDGERISSLAQHARTGEEPAAAPEASIEADAPDTAPSIEPAAIEAVAPATGQDPTATAPFDPFSDAEEVTIGSAILARSFFEVYRREAVQHAATLVSEYAAWCNKPDSEAPHELLRAAHTLASSSRTAGFTAIADLAGAVEHWAPLAHQVSNERDLSAVETAIDTLRKMVEAVDKEQPPAPADEATHRLREATARLQGQAAAIPPSDPVPAAADAPARILSEPQREPAHAPSGTELRRMHDDIDGDLLPVFLEEARELLPLIGADLREWKASPADHRIPQSMMRALHTLKGSARMAGAIRLGELTHLMESRVEAAVQAEIAAPELFEDLELKMDRLSLDVDRMQEGRAVLDAAPAESTAISRGEAPRDAAPRAEPPLPSPAALLRVNADTLDHLINASGEVSIARSRIEAELRAVKQSLADLNESISRLRGQLREVEIQADSQLQTRASVLDERNREFDPLEFDRYTRLQELTRMMGESLHDAATIQQGLLESLGETESALLQQARINRDVQQDLMRMRAVPFSNLNERLYRTVRQVARDLGKKAELEIEGSQVELDRGVLERIGAPLEHMLRNALAHGLEAPAGRLAAGKPEAGRIAISVRQESNEIALVMSDDGTGLDLEALRAKAIDCGILRRKQHVTESELAQLVFAGVSTAEEVTELAGRGIGMDVVRSEISALGGRVDVATARGKGTTFTVYLPLTLAVTQAVLVRAGHHVLAISSAMVEQVLRYKTDEMPRLYDSRIVESQNRSYPLHCLHHLLGGAEGPRFQSYNSVLLLRSGAQRIALHVDELIGNQEIVVKNIGPQLARVPGVAGATVLADGRIALIVNPVQLAQQPARAAPAPAAVSAATADMPAAPLIMVVDDSLTVRKVTSRLLEREGYRTATAKDGVDALEQMRDTLPDVLLIDIEMPRMDGFDLARAVRREPRTRAIPLIIVSSRTAEKHRNLAVEIGVNAFLGKPFQESDLLEHVARFIATPKRAVSHT